MTFETQNGTRGARQPKAGLPMRLVNRFAMSRARKGGKLGPMNMLVLTTIGKKSGEPRQSPLAWFPETESSWLIAASAGGAPKSPAWYHNLAAHPADVTIEIGGRTVAVTPEQLHGDERKQAWKSIVAAAPQFAGYAEKTDREIPVIRLTAR